MERGSRNVFGFNGFLLMTVASRHATHALMWWSCMECTRSNRPMAGLGQTGAALLNALIRLHCTSQGSVQGMRRRNFVACLAQIKQRHTPAPGTGEGAGSHP